MSQSTDRVVEPLVKALSSVIDSRFQAELTDKEQLASALLPQFKLNFLPESAKRQVFNYVQQEVAVESHTEAHLPTAYVAQDDDDFSAL